MRALDRRLRRYYVDGESKPPRITGVMPGDEDYAYAHETLGSAKAALLNLLASRIAELREVSRQVRALRLDDFS